MRKVCLALALFLALSLAVPTFAADPPLQEEPQTEPVSSEDTSAVLEDTSSALEDLSSTSEDSASVPEEAAPMEDNTPVIQVTVPQMGQIIINPYGLPTDLDGETSSEQIVSQTLTISNESNTSVTVSVSAIGHVSEESGLVYAANPPQPDSTQKEIFLYAEFQNKADRWSGCYSNEANQLLISDEVSEPKPVLTLDEASEGVFRLFGAASTMPEEDWCGEDQISVTLTFTFAPVAALDTEQGSESGDSTVPDQAAAPENPSIPEQDPDQEDPSAVEEDPENPSASEQDPELEDPSAVEEDPENPSVSEQDPELEDPSAVEEDPENPSTSEQDPDQEDHSAMEEGPENPSTPEQDSDSENIPEVSL